MTTTRSLALAALLLLVAGCTSCGGGGTSAATVPLFNQEAAFADLLVTTCPFCVNNLNVGKETSNSKARVVDLVELIDELM